MIRVPTSALAACAVALMLATASPPAAQTRVEEGFVQGADGVRLFYRRATAGPAVAVLLHGGPGSNLNAVWPDLQPLAGGRTLIAYDQRGGGRSEIIKDASRLTAADHVRDLEALRQALGLDRFALVGESWGAGLAALYAAEHPERVERLLLIGPIAPTRALLDRRMDESDAAMSFRARLAAITRAMPDATDPIATCHEFFNLYLKQFFARPDGFGRRLGSSCDAPPEGVRNYFVVNQATFASLGSFDLRPLLARLAMPAMVIEGEQSIPTTVESARAFARALPNATLVLIPGAGHYPQVEQPDAFFKAAKTFLDAGVTPSPPADERMIRDARARSNAAIAKHDIAGIARVWMDTVHVVTSTSAQATGRDANGQRMAKQFASRPDTVYVRRPTAVDVYPAWAVASERGEWTGTWTEPDGALEIGGTYQAQWRKVEGEWLIQAELFVPTRCRGGKYCGSRPQ